MQSKLIPHTCEQCGESFSRYLSQSTNIRFCSRRCKGIAKRSPLTLSQRRHERHLRAKPNPPLPPDLPGEEWRPVFGYEGFYEVSNLGRVRSMTRRMGTWPGRLLRQTLLKTGYYRVVLAPGDRPKKPQSVHRLVASAFIRPPLPKEQVNHIDGVRNNNHVSNLEWVTCAENIRHGHARRAALMSTS